MSLVPGVDLQLSKETTVKIRVANPWGLTYGKDAAFVLARRRYLAMTDLLEFENVEAVAVEGDALLCRLAGREFRVPREKIALCDNAVSQPGHRGSLAIPRELASDLGLVDLAKRVAR